MSQAITAATGSGTSAAIHGKVSCGPWSRATGTTIGGSVGGRELRGGRRNGTEPLIDEVDCDRSGVSRSSRKRRCPIVKVCSCHGVDRSHSAPSRVPLAVMTDTRPAMSTVTSAYESVTGASVNANAWALRLGPSRYRPGESWRRWPAPGPVNCTTVAHAPVGESSLTGCGRMTIPVSNPLAPVDVSLGTVRPSTSTSGGGGEPVMARTRSPTVSAGWVCEMLISASPSSDENTSSMTCRTLTASEGPLLNARRRPPTDPVVG